MSALVDNCFHGHFPRPCVMSLLPGDGVNLTSSDNVTAGGVISTSNKGVTGDGVTSNSLDILTSH